MRIPVQAPQRLIGEQWREWIECATQKTFRPHCLTYGKVMEKDDPFGRILPRFEHRRTAQTKGFPADLEKHCTVPEVFPGWFDTTMSLSSTSYENAGFAVRSFKTDVGNEYKVLAKISPWSEDGAVQNSRKFTHMNVWAFEEVKFDPLAIPLLVLDLFWPMRGDSGYGLSLPTVEDCVDPFFQKRPELSYRNFEYFSLFWDDFPRDTQLIEEMFQNDLQRSRPGDFDEKVVKMTYFLIRVVKLVRENAFSYLKNPSSLNFTCGVTPTETARALGIFQY